MNGNLVIKAIKLIYPAIQGGYSYWETRYDGTPWTSPSEGLVWENKEYGKPDWNTIMEKLNEAGEI